MGVPKFFRWVTNRYPQILSGPITGPPSEPNVDNLYLDMNGVIHECSHTNEDVSADVSFEVICSNIFAEILRIFNLVNPQELIYIAVDGVAPRAKLNQQRARRFRSSRDRIKALAESGAASSFDSNCITPGTEFMVRLCAALKIFIAHKLQNDPVWHKLKVHFSGSEVPGEGEHKIVSFIRESRLSPTYQPNKRHCILGADADMIMLALATHEPYFLVLRDIPTFTRSKKPSNTTDNTTSTKAHTPNVMNYVRINVLREFLVTELLESLNMHEYDTERIVDDFVFLTFLVGNDFLPHLPAINIGDDAFDIIFDAYKTVLASEPGYLVDAGTLDITRLELILALIGVTERSLFYDQVLMQEQKARQAAERREKYALLRAQREAEAAAELSATSATSSGLDSSVVSDTVVSESEVPTTVTSAITTTTTTPTSASPLPAAFYSFDPASILDREEACKHDYYLSKLGLDLHTTEGQEGLREVVNAYLTGLQWCLQYYSTGCTSWEWYYPYHYGPFLQDMTSLNTVPSYSTVPLGNPLQPFQQLLACLPAASCGLLPAPYHALMSTHSSIAHFYPTDFETDLNGKKNEYESVVILPFIEISLLKSAEAECVSSTALTSAEQARNKFGVSYVYCMHTDSSSRRDVLHVVEVPFTTTPSQPFAASLFPGTTDPRSSIPGFPSRAALLEVVNYTKGYGKSKASRKNIRSRANCYESEGNESFPMPGVTSVTSGVSDVDVVFEDATVNTHSASTVKSVDGSSNSNTSTVHGVGGVMRLVVDERTSQFLLAVAAQVAEQSPHFIPVSTAESSDTSSDTSSVYINLSLSDVLGAATAAQYESALLNNNVLATAGGIFGTVKGALQPVGLLSLDGSVSVKYVDVSHLGQVEEFILQRVLGNDLLDSLNSLNIGSGGNSGANGNGKGSGKGTKGSGRNNSDSRGIGFERSIVIGSYTGNDAVRFVEWLNQQLYKLAEHLPVFSCHVLQYVGQSSDGENEEVKVNVSLSG